MASPWGPDTAPSPMILISTTPALGACSERDGERNHNAVSTNADRRATFQVLIIGIAGGFSSERFHKSSSRGRSSHLKVGSLDENGVNQNQHSDNHTARYLDIEYAKSGEYSAFQDDPRADGH